MPQGQNIQAHSSGLKFKILCTQSRLSELDGGATLAIDCKQKRIGRCILSNHWKEGMRDESPQRLAEEGTIANGLLLIHIPHGSRTGEHNQAVLPFSLVRWNRLSSPHNSSTEDQPVSTQGGAAPQETSDQPDSAYTPLHFNAHNPNKYA